MNRDKIEIPVNRLDSIEESTDSYPLIEKINSRPVTTAINRSVDDSFDYSTHAPEEIAQPPTFIRQVVQAVEGPNTVTDTFNPQPYQARVKKAAKCLRVFGWIMIICGGLNIFFNVIAMIFMGGDHDFAYKDIDGQKIQLTIDGNSWFMFAFFKIVVGGLTLWQGKIINKVFKPIIKEYQDAEAGRTQGISMTQRKSKKMMHLKKKIYKITCATTFIGLLALMYAKNFQDEMIDDWMDQKYEYIAMHNNSVNGTYSVDGMRSKMAHTFNPVDKKKDQIPDFGLKPEHHEAPPKDDDFEPRQVDWEGTWKQVEDEMKNITDIYHKSFDEEWEREMKKFNQYNTTDLYHHGFQHHGQQPMRHPSKDDDDKKEHDSRKSQWKKQDPYKEWLDELPFMEKEDAAATVKAFMSCIVTVCAVWGYVCYAAWQGFQLCMISGCMKAQKTLEDKYMGPEIRQVRPTARQVAATTAGTNERPQPVIQYIVEPSTTTQTSATGNIVTANQII